MKYMLMIYEDEKVFGPGKEGPAMREIVGKHMDYVKELGASYVGGAGLTAAALATSVRTAKGRKSIHDGPFAETKEQLGGYYVVDVADLDAAIALAKKVPLVEDGCIEIRPLLGP